MSKDELKEDPIDSKTIPKVKLPRPRDASTLPSSLDPRIIELKIL